MPFPIDQPFPMPSSPPLERYVGAEAMRTYLDIFLNHQHERPGRKFADADVTEFLRLAEHLGKVTDIEMQYIEEELLGRRADLFTNQAQMARLRILVRNHRKRNEVSQQDDFVKKVMRFAAISYFRNAQAFDMIAKAQELSAAINQSRAFYIEHGSDDPDLVGAVNRLSNELAEFIDDFSLSDIDDPGKSGHEARRRNFANFFRRMTGEVDHEAKWDKDAKTWQNWNRDITIYPADFFWDKKEKPEVKTSGVAEAIKTHDPVRLVAGGHAFNTSSDTGGTKAAGFGTLITLDQHRLDSGKQWELLSATLAADLYHLADGNHVVRVSTGMRLRDFTAKVWEQGMALPVAGSTDAQSIGGLIATDLHSTGHTAGFLSQQLLEVVVLDHKGDTHRFRRDDSVPHGQSGRWTWIRPDASTEPLRKLPPAGGIGMTGVVVEAVLKLVSGFSLEKHERFVSRSWIEQNIEKFLDPQQGNPVFAYPHVSMYYTGGFGADIQSVQLNTWRHTDKTQPPDALKVKQERELLDHVGSAFFPEELFELASLEAPSFPDNQGGHRRLRDLNDREEQVLQANFAFARKLYFQHDEIEVGVPLTPLVNGKPDYQIFRKAIQATQEFLDDEELKTIIEIRFTPDASEGMLGPGAGGPTCYVELATSMTLYSRERIVQVFHQFDKLLRDNFGAFPHLGKKTTVDAADMANLYGADWTKFNEVRMGIDPAGKFRPAKNELLNRLFA